jgi:hypothetical protein
MPHAGAPVRKVALGHSVGFIRGQRHACFVAGLSGWIDNHVLRPRQLPEGNTSQGQTRNQI